MKHLITALGIILSIGLPHAAHAQSVTVPPLPANLEVRDGSQPYLIGHAVGTQNYICQPSPLLGRVAWTLFTPEAVLFDDRSEQLITHFFSPNPDEGNSVIRATWRDSDDTSIFWGRGIASSTDAAFVNAGAVAWVLLERAGRRAGPNGGTTLFDATFVQRVNTVGGVAPATDCNDPTDIGNKAFMPYTADYIFYKK